MTRAILICVVSLAAVARLYGAEPVPTQVVTTVALCEVIQHPADWDKKLIEVSGELKQGFEDFSLNPVGDCAPQPTMVWLEFGGTVNSGTVYCCGDHGGPGRREQNGTVGDTEIPLVEDRLLKQLVRRVHRNRYGGYLKVKVTVVGRYFSGEQVKTPSGVWWMGYGHLGCCSLLMIQQVKAVE